MSKTDFQDQRPKNQDPRPRPMNQIHNNLQHGKISTPGRFREQSKKKKKKLLHFGFWILDFLEFYNLPSFGTSSQQHKDLEPKHLRPNAQPPTHQDPIFYPWWRSQKYSEKHPNHLAQDELHETKNISIKNPKHLT